MSMRRSDTGMEVFSWVKDISPKPSRTFTDADLLNFSNDGSKIIYKIHDENYENHVLILQDVKGMTFERIPLERRCGFIGITPDLRHCWCYDRGLGKIDVPIKCFQYNFDTKQVVAFEMEPAGFWDMEDGELEYKFSPDGKTLATCCRGKKLKLWGVTSHTCAERFTVLGHSADNPECICAHGRNHARYLFDPLCPVTGHKKETECLAFSPDNKTLASADDGNTVKLWEMSWHGPTLKTNLAENFKAGGVIREMAFSPDGKILACAAYYDVSLWNLETMTIEHRIDLRQYGASNRCQARIAWSPDGTTFACASFNPRAKTYNAYLFKTETYQLQKILQKVPRENKWVDYSQTTIPVQDLIFSPDSSMLACKYGVAEEVTVWFRKHLIHGAMKRVSKDMPWEKGRFKDMAPEVWAENFIETEW